MASNEKLSKAQAEKIINEANKIYRNCKGQMDEKIEEFAGKVSDVWEDENAVEFAKQLKKNVEGFISEMSTNNKTFATRVKEIADAYLKEGKMGLTVGAVAAKLSSNINVAKIKKFFGNSENSDDFGFNGVDAPDRVMDAWNTLKADLQKIAADTISDINSIPAFSNPRVRANIAKSAGGIVDILKGHVDECEKSVKELLQKTASSYKQLGSSAETAADIKKGA